MEELRFFYRSQFFANKSEVHLPKKVDSTFLIATLLTPMVPSKGKSYITGIELECLAIFPRGKFIVKSGMIVVAIASSRTAFAKNVESYLMQNS